MIASLMVFCFKSLWIKLFMNHGAFAACRSDLFHSGCNLLICVFYAWLNAGDAYSMMGLIN